MSGKTPEDLKLLGFKVRNHQSVFNHPEIAKELIQKELNAGRYAGPFSSSPFPIFQVSPIKLQPKKEVGKYRLIHNVSYPYDQHSINGSISRDNSSVSYASIQDAISIIQKLGKGCFMAKSDIQSAYRLVPVSPEDYPKLGFQFRNDLYFDKCLAQGCASSCKIFEEFSSALEWILRHKYNVKFTLHVLDDFAFFAPDYEKCLQYLLAWKSLCSELNIPLCPEKTLDPSRLMVFLGVELSSVDMEARLPAEKLDKYREKLTDLTKHRKTTLENMQSVIGCLQFATSVIIPGRAFVRRLIDTTIGVKKPSHFVTLNDGTTADIKMWLTFFQFHNGKTIFIQPEAESSISLHMYTDASKQACAATFKSSWFVIGFPVDWQGKNIAFLELYPIVVALQIFGIRLANRAVVFHCDNKAIVQIINKQSSRDKCIMGLVRHLVMTAMQYNIKFSSKHVEGKKNILADKLSRLQVTSHLLSSFGMSPYPTSVPARLQPSDYRPL